MSATRFLAADGMASWLADVAKTHKVFAPKKEGKSVVFRQWTADSEAPILDKATVSPKGVVLPSSETLFTFKTEKDAENLAKTELKLDNAFAAEPTVIFACRSCDTRGFVHLDFPYMQGKFKDPYYIARREATVIVTRACDAQCATCFCTSVGGGPTSTEGSDIQMTVIDGGYLLEGISEKGTALLTASTLPDGADKLAEAKAHHKEVEANVNPTLDFSKSAERLKERFEDMDFWTEQTTKCLSCAACTYMCPTCQCFNITDEGEAASPAGGRRVRTWDYCMSPLFTREASGHNPRTAKGARMRNRVSHKYWYTSEYKGDISCTGCGRCIMHCPSSVDIREIVLKAIEKA